MTEWWDCARGREGREGRGKWARLLGKEGEIESMGPGRVGSQAAADSQLLSVTEGMVDLQPEGLLCILGKRVASK